MSPDQPRGGARTATKLTVEVAGRQLVLSNLDKPLYPDGGFTKGEMVDYYTRIAPVLLPHVAGRPLTVKRYPDGVDGPSFFEKNAPSHTPAWVRTVILPSPGSTKDRGQVRYLVLEALPELVWAANLASIELHVPMWRVDDSGRPQNPDRLVIDLDPGPPATIVECCTVAQRVREALAMDGLDAQPKTSGSKGLQLYVALDGSRGWEHVHAYARQLAERLERAGDGLVVSSMRKDIRRGKVLIDWSQNNAAKTTVAPYSLRARPEPTASTPVSWDEIRACRRPEDLRFEATDVLARVERDGDLFAAVLTESYPLP
ncbi:MAG TPA: non-homologous end-joining DNA ligase [Mycobacteriales bacterium]|nr:non-homologous end-joining DNA ligase [Mycobacteriales bacterium]